MQRPIIVPKTRIGKYLQVYYKLTIPLPLSVLAENEAYEQVTAGFIFKNMICANTKSMFFFIKSDILKDVIVIFYRSLKTL